jgi:hypothetical protein
MKDSSKLYFVSLFYLVLLYYAPTMLISSFCLIIFALLQFVSLVLFIQENRKKKEIF